MISRLLDRPLYRWSLRLLSFSALAVCLWLWSRKLSGEISSLVGCGGEGGCSQVMGGRWSEWFHLPVTLLAALVHAAALCLTLPSVRRRLGAWGDVALATAGVLLGGAAVYFLTILYAVEHRHCPWCLGLHLAGLVVAGLILRDGWRQSGPGGLKAALLAGGLGLATLAAGQAWGPRPATYLLTGGATAPEPTAPAAVGPQELSFLEGKLKLDAAALPRLGSLTARIVLVEFFDYTCSSCRNLAADFKELNAKWPGTFGMIPLPAPLNRACNPGLKPKVPDHLGACDLAKLALALWKAKPSAFVEFHEYLLASPLPATPERIAEARRRAAELAGEGALAAALQDPWVGQRLAENFVVFGQITSQSIVMPKLLFPTSGVMHGTAPSAAQFIKLMEDRFQLRAGGAAPAKEPR